MFRRIVRLSGIAEFKDKPAAVDGRGNPKLACQASLLIPVHHQIGCDLVDCKAEPVHRRICQTRILARFRRVLANGLQSIKITRYCQCLHLAAFPEISADSISPAPNRLDNQLFAVPVSGSVSVTYTPS